MREGQRDEVHRGEDPQVPTPAAPLAEALRGRTRPLRVQEHRNRVPGMHRHERRGRMVSGHDKDIGLESGHALDPPIGLLDRRNLRIEVAILAPGVRCLAVDEMEVEALEIAGE